jgi:hypothetical protein
MFHVNKILPAQKSLCIISDDKTSFKCKITQICSHFFNSILKEQNFLHLFLAQSDSSTKSKGTSLIPLPQTECTKSDFGNNHINKNTGMMDAALAKKMTPISIL